MNPRLPTVLALLLASVSPPAQEAATPPSPVAAAEDAVRAVLTAWRERAPLPGASCGFVLADGSIGAVAVGVADEDGGEALTPQHRLMSGSIGKTYVAAVALRLAARGELDLDGKVADVLGERDWYPRLANAADLRLRHLLRHQSGIREHVWKEELHRALFAEPDRTWKPAELIAFALDDPPQFAAGEQFAYADTNYVLLGMVLEAVTGRSWEDLLAAELLRPLGLDDTRATTARRLHGLANGHTSGRAILPRGPVLRDGLYPVNPQFEWCGGGVHGTPRDLARWCHLLHASDRVLDDEWRRRMRDAVAAERIGPGVRYGLGCMVVDSPHGEAWGHTGIMPGYLSAMFHYPKPGVSVAVQVNTDDGRRLGGRPSELAHACAGALQPR